MGQRRLTRRMETHQVEAFSRQRAKGIESRIRERKIRARNEKDFLWERQSDAKEKRVYDREGKTK